MFIKRFVAVCFTALLFLVAASPNLVAQDACDGCQPSLSAINVTSTFNCSTMLFSVNSGTNNVNSGPNARCRRLGMEWTVTTDANAQINDGGGQALITFSSSGFHEVCVSFTVALIQSDGNFDTCTVTECVTVEVCP